ncbi:DUF6053 domain-containing protein [Lysobacter enzymogenes]|uniref:DUF6053 domain-containing protein n=1 Tax=Lysobacter enzymogenes TaxID=69 RepID=UPI003D188F9B
MWGTSCGRAFRPDAFRSDRSTWAKSVGAEAPPTVALLAGASRLWIPAFAGMTFWQRCIGFLWEGLQARRFSLRPQRLGQERRG